jgi:hypothetical protein
MLKSFVVFVLCVVFAIVGTAALAKAAEANHWCCVHGWALMHGSGEAVLLGFGLIGFHVVSTLGSRAGYLPSSWPPGWLAHAAYLASAVGTYEYLTYCDAFMWCGLAVAILACVLRMRGRPVRQFGLAVVSLVVSCLGVYQWGHMKWMIWRLGY